MRKVLFLLLAIATLVISNSSLAADPASSQDSSVSPGDNDFITITDTSLGNFQIQGAPISVAEYGLFLTAVAAKQDLHRLYNEKMAKLITYNRPWFSPNYYLPAPGKANLWMTYITLADAMHYCNWKENGGLTAEQDPNCTEKGAYDFTYLNEDGFPTPNPDDTYQLPTIEQLEHVK